MAVLLSEKDSCCLGIIVPRCAGVLDTSDVNFNDVSNVKTLSKRSALAPLKFIDKLRSRFECLHTRVRKLLAHETRRCRVQVPLTLQE